MSSATIAFACAVALATVVPAVLTEIEIDPFEAFTAAAVFASVAFAEAVITKLPVAIGTDTNLGGSAIA